MPPGIVSPLRPLIHYTPLEKPAERIAYRRNSALEWADVLHGIFRSGRQHPRHRSRVPDGVPAPVRRKIATRNARRIDRYKPLRPRTAAPPPAKARQGPGAPPIARNPLSFPDEPRPSSDPRNFPESLAPKPNRRSGSRSTATLPANDRHRAAGPKKGFVRPS